MKDIIDHTGSVESIEGTHVRIRILQSSACSACQAKSLCASAEAKEKIVDVWDTHADRLTVGEQVKVCASMQMSLNAVLKWLVLSELMAIGGVLLLLFIYYIGLWSVREKLSRKFAFWIEKD